MNTDTPNNTTDLESDVAQVKRLEGDVAKLEDQLRQARNHLDSARRRLAKDLCKGPVLGRPTMKVARRSVR